MVASLPARVQAMNADPRYIYTVTKVAVFGSFLRDKSVLGDVDIAWDRNLRDCVEGPGSLFKRFNLDVPPPQHVELNYFARLCWPETKFVRDLKTGSGMRIHDWRELLLLKCPYRVIFQRGEDD